MPRNASRRHFHRTACIHLACLALASPALAAELTIPGTGDSQDLLRALASSYEASHPGTTITIPDSTGSFATKPGTLGGMESAGTQTTELGRTAVRPRPEDLKRFGSLYYLEFARIPVAFVVGTAAGVADLTREQLCGLFRGDITNWKDVGGADVAVAVQARPEGSNMLAIRSAVACFEDLVVTGSARNNLRNSDLVESMQQTAGAIGFMPLSEARAHGFSTVRLDRMAPNSGDYPLGIGLGLVHKEPLTGLARDFTEYLRSEEAHRIMRDTGHIPVVADSELSVASVTEPAAASEAGRSASYSPQVGGFIQGGFSIDPDASPETSFFLKRARFGARGKVLHESLSYRVLLELRPPGPRLLDYYVGLERWRHTLRFGQFRIPFGWENAHRVRGLPTLDRSLLSKRLASASGDLRDLGLSITGTVPLGGELVFEDAVAVFNGAGSNRADHNHWKDVAGRLGVRYGKFARLGASAGSYRLAKIDPDDPTMRFRERSVRAGVDLGIETSFAKLAAEAIIAEFSEPTELSRFGYYILGSTRVHSHIEAAARFAEYDPDTDSDDDEQRRLTLVVNYIDDPEDPLACRVSLQYRRDLDPTAHEIAAYILLSF